MTVHKQASLPTSNEEPSSPEQGLEIEKEFGKELDKELDKEIDKEVDKYKAAKDADERLKVFEIVERVKQSKKPFFRPDTTTLVDCPPNLLRCIHACWEELPESRPTMRLINRKLRKLHDGL